MESKINGSDKNVACIEEDIETLKELIDEYKSAAVIGLDMQVDVTFREKQCKALEHLIKAYKEKEQIEEEHKKINGELREKVKQLEEEKGWLLEEVNHLNEEKWKDFEFFVNSLSKTIPKSKIKEIRDKAEVMDYYTLSDVIDDLNKLLEVE